MATNKKHMKVTFKSYAVVPNVSGECFAFSDTPTDVPCSLVMFKKEVETFIEGMSDTADTEKSYQFRVRCLLSHFFYRKIMLNRFC